ncbi:hypothetical protein [Cereibacter azotoformans]|uniref:Uncharacterized protein n=1 Tax=Cereibacter azotoformans TaxID=43057 RepID=A0A2T5JTB2_9RHOB|nr:hypothetical protein [Cereibacter azotoformans]PTR13407.1 hypothetical protein C8J28_12237 [Cereibacter azotoformans]
MNERFFIGLTLGATLIGIGPALSQARPEPDPNDLYAVIDWVLETNSCTASESRIFNELQTRSDLGTAGIVIRNWTEAADFNKSYRVHENAEHEFIYTMTSGPVCG